VARTHTINFIARRAFEVMMDLTVTRERIALESQWRHPRTRKNAIDPM